MEFYRDFLPNKKVSSACNETLYIAKNPRKLPVHHCKYLQCSSQPPILKCKCLGNPMNPKGSGMMSQCNVINKKI